jgi:hypothetical protein
MKNKYTLIALLVLLLAIPFTIGGCPQAINLSVKNANCPCTLMVRYSYIDGTGVETQPFGPKSLTVNVPQGQTVGPLEYGNGTSNWTVTGSCISTGSGSVVFGAGSGWLHTFSCSKTGDAEEECTVSAEATPLDGETPSGLTPIN